jgi:hypothetical protein
LFFCLTADGRFFLEDMFIGWSQERKDGEAEGRYYHGDDGWLHRAMVLHGRGHVVRVFQTVTERMVTFSVELRGTFYVSTDERCRCERAIARGNCATWRTRS